MSIPAALAAARSSLARALSDVDGLIEHLDDCDAAQGREAQAAREAAKR